MKVICIHHRLGGYSSHHYTESRGLIRELGRRGRELVLLVPRRVEPSIVAELRARPDLDDDPTFQLAWSFEERSRRFLDMLHRRVDRFVNAEDRVLITISTQLEAHALTRWIRELPRRRKPWIVVLFLSDRWNRAGREEYERQTAELRELGAAIASLSPDDARRMVFCTVTELLAEELSGFLGTRVVVAPMPQAYDDPRPEPPPHSGPPCVALLGGTRREKGSYRIPDIIRACRAHVQVEFLVHLTNNSLTAVEAEQLARIADEPGVTVIPDEMQTAAYQAALDRADLGLFPYELIPYRKRTSGVFAEMIVHGKPVIVTPGTWLAEQVEAGRASGMVSDDHTPDAIARAIARCVADLEGYRRTARSLSAEWRRTISLSAFLDLMEQEIAGRAQEEKPRRRFFWFQ